MAYFTEDNINRAIVLLQSKLLTCDTTEENGSGAIFTLPLTFMAHAAGQVSDENILERFFRVLNTQSRNERKHTCDLLLATCKPYQIPVVYNLLQEISVQCVHFLESQNNTQSDCPEEGTQESFFGYFLLLVLQKTFKEAQLQHCIV